MAAPMRPFRPRKARIRTFTFKTAETNQATGGQLPAGWIPLSAEVVSNGRVYVVAWRWA